VKIRAIQTAYDKRLFRSRAEARWAVFFKCLEIQYEYEPEGIEMNGVRYLPDFKLSVKHHGKYEPLWVEIKPAEWNDDDKLGKLAEYLPSSHRLTKLPSLEAYLNIVENTGIAGEIECLWGKGDNDDIGADYGYMFCVCPDCETAGFEFNGRAARLKCCAQISNAKGHEDKNYQYDHPIIMNAIQHALSERFGT
jgi:hypothetical protein